MEAIEENEKLITKLDHQIDLIVSHYEKELELLQTIDGVGKDTALVIIREVGVDMDAFPNQYHLEVGRA